MSYKYPKGALRREEILALPIPSVVFTVIPDASTWWGKSFIIDNVKQLKMDQKPLSIRYGYNLHFEHPDGGIQADQDCLIEWSPCDDFRHGFLFKNPLLAIVYFNSVRNQK